MKCETPLWIKQNNLQKGVDVPCGKCIPCLENRRAVWTFRIMQELEVAETARFVTLTYDEKHLPWINEKAKIGTIWNNSNSPCGMKQLREQNKTLEETLCLTDLQKFLKNVRKEIQKYYEETFKGSKINDLKEAIRYVKKSEKSGKWSPKLRYFACGEYGTKGDRPHYHIILFNVPLEWYIWDTIHKEWYSPKLEKIWSKGIIDIKEVERGSAHYVAKYTIKNSLDGWNDKDIRTKPFAVMSKNPGIGNNYINDENRDYHLSSQTYHTRLKGGYIQPIGRYYKQKIFERETPDKEGVYYETETGERVQRDSRIQIRKPEESKAIRKTNEILIRKENAKKEQTYAETDGDIEESEMLLHKRRTEAIETNNLKSRNTYLKGRKL